MVANIVMSFGDELCLNHVVSEGRKFINCQFLNSKCEMDFIREEEDIPFIIDTTFEGDGTGFGVYAKGAIRLHNCKISNYKTCVYFWPIPQLNSTFNKVIIANASETGLYIESGTDDTLSGFKISKCKTGVFLSNSLLKSHLRDFEITHCGRGVVLADNEGIEMRNSLIADCSVCGFYSYVTSQIKINTCAFNSCMVAVVIRTMIGHADDGRNYSIEEARFRKNTVGDVLLVGMLPDCFQMKDCTTDDISKIGFIQSHGEYGMTYDGGWATPGRANSTDDVSSYRDSLTCIDVSRENTSFISCIETKTE